MQFCNLSVIISIVLIIIQLNDLYTGMPLSTETLNLMTTSLSGIEIENSSQRLAINENLNENWTQISNLSTDLSILSSTTLDRGLLDNNNNNNNTVKSEIIEDLNQSTMIVLSDDGITKIPEQEDNPNFVNCVNSCGSDHDCVRAKCLNDSTYFG